jgi:gliding motility-associated-like protein
MEKIFKIILILLLCFPVLVSAQYLENPSFEGPRGIALTPNGWSPFGLHSTPDTEPLNCDVFKASDGDTYLTLVARGSESQWPGVSEQCQAMLIEPLLQGMCYTLTMDLATRNDLGYYVWGEGFIHYRADVSLKVYGSNSSSGKGVLLAETGPVTNVNWENSSFTIKPESNIYYLLLEVALVNESEENGNLLIDKMTLTDYMLESTVVLNETFGISELPITIEASESSSYTWTPNTGLSCYDCRSPQVNSDIGRTYSCLITSSSNACPAEELFIINFDDDIVLPEDFKIPNVFTPNGDGINDMLEIAGLPPFSSLLIFDRLGHELYSSEIYNNDWNGSDVNGNPLPEDTYWYVLILPGRTGRLKGSIYLKRK